MSSLHCCFMMQRFNWTFNKSPEPCSCGVRVTKYLEEVSAEKHRRNILNVTSIEDELFAAWHWHQLCIITTRLTSDIFRRKGAGRQHPITGVQMASSTQIATSEPVCVEDTLEPLLHVPHIVRLFVGNSQSRGHSLHLSLHVCKFANSVFQLVFVPI